MIKATQTAADKYYSPLFRSLTRRGLKSNTEKPVALFLNSARLNYDSIINFDKLRSITDLTLNHVDSLRSPDEIRSLLQVKQPEILILKEIQLPLQEIIDVCEGQLKLICEAGTGFNNIPIQFARKHNIDVCNIPTYSNESVAHMVITYIMCFSAAIFDQARMLNHNDRTNFRVFQHPIYEIQGKTLGLVGGSGTIGTCVTGIALKLGMKVLISSRSKNLPSNHAYANHPRVHVVSKEFLFKNSDFVSINCPLNDKTYHSIRSTDIRRMKPTAFLINTARGAIIHEQELIQCMKENVIAGAGLDTQEIEPPPESSELWKLDNVFMSPHIGWRRYETRQRLADMTMNNVAAYIEGTPINIVN